MYFNECPCQLLKNFQGFGDMKIIPGIEIDKLEGLIKISPIWPELEPLWNMVKDIVYDLSPGKTCLGYRPHGISTYLSSNMTPEDAKIVQQWMSKHKVGYYNTRAFKTVNNNGKTEFEIRLASEETGEVQRTEEDGYVFRITKGDYGPIMGATAR